MALAGHPIHSISFIILEVTALDVRDRIVVHLMLLGKSIRGPYTVLMVKSNVMVHHSLRSQEGTKLPPFFAVMQPPWEFPGPPVQYVPSQKYVLSAASQQARHANARAATHAGQVCIPSNRRASFFLRFPLQTVQDVRLYSVREYVHKCTVASELDTVHGVGNAIQYCTVR